MYISKTPIHFNAALSPFSIQSRPSWRIWKLKEHSVLQPTQRAQCMFFGHPIIEELSIYLVSVFLSLHAVI